MNAVFAADMLVIPSGPGYWEYDSTTSFIGQLAEALEDLSHGFEGTFPAGKIGLPKAFHDVRFLLTRYEPGNELHRAMYEAFGKVFGDRLSQSPIEMTRAVEQSGTLPQLGLRDRLPGDDARDLAPGARHLRPRLA